MALNILNGFRTFLTSLLSFSNDQITIG